MSMTVLQEQALQHRLACREQTVQSRLSHGGVFSCRGRASLGPSLGAARLELEGTLSPLLPTLHGRAILL